MQYSNFCFRVILLVLLVVADSTFGIVTIPANDANINYIGRTAVTSGGLVELDWSGVQVSLQFTGSTSIGVVLEGGQNQYNVILDGNQIDILKINSSTTYTLASSLSTGAHTLLLTKRTEAFFYYQTFHSFLLSDGGRLLSPPARPTRKLEFIGDSITCGYGDEGKLGCSFSADTENNYLSYGPVISRYFKAEYYLTCWSGKGVVRNYGSPNLTSPDPFPTYYNRTLASIDYSASDLWNFKTWRPDAVVINLGTNDYSSSPNPPEDVFVNGFTRFIEDIRSLYGNYNVPVFLACGPMASQTPTCDNVEKVVSSNTNVYYIPMVGILSYPSDYGCDYHPAVSGHQKMAEASYKIISQVLGWN